MNVIQKWIKEAQAEIEINKQFLADTEDVSSREPHWHEVKDEREAARRRIKILQQAINIVQQVANHPENQSEPNPNKS